ncbi:oxidoreductase-like domain-containing protein [Massilia sp. BJB1822]|uniref:oxidoreductase-like domain-containing protein n=1 Tax=Massilia sp. BJB1822 TaxID=2744470 RepID=UPI0015932C5F|nr:oxidoreductase-like domain-containing protein [Massilia sp. BJB1822]NVE01872.1 hypothetical protein [Massilia sp. BJB1822]
MPPKSPLPTPADPRPAAPPRPDADECCRGGCDWCVLDEYEAALERYRRALAEWQARQAS